VVLLFVAGVQVARVDHLLHRWWCADELEHLHAAWCIAQGQVPYRDFFEHHTPALYYLLAPVVGAMHPERSAERAVATIVVSRFLMWGLCGLLLGLIYRLGRWVHSRMAGAVAVLLALSSMMFLDRTLEIRPDLISVPAMLAGVWLAGAGFRRAGRGAGWQLFWSGACWGVGFLASPKVLFALLGFCPAVMVLLADPRRAEDLRRRVMMGVALAAGFFVMLAVVAGLFAMAGAAGDLVHYTFLMNARWKFHLEPWQAIAELAYEAPVLVAMGLAGLARGVIRACGRGGVRRGLVLPVGTLVGTIVGIFLIPVPYTEYFLMPISLLAVYGAVVVVEFSGWVGRWRRVRTGAMVVGAAGVFAFILVRLRPPFVGSGVEGAVLGLALVGGCVLLFLRRRHVGLLVVMAGLAIFPFRRTPLVAGPSNADQRASLAYVQEHTSAGDRVFDGWEHITAPFRPHAWFYFFLHREIRPMLTEGDYDELLSGLETGKIRPAVVVMDADNGSLPGPIVEWLEGHYPVAPLGAGSAIRLPANFRGEDLPGGSRRATPGEGSRGRLRQVGQDLPGLPQASGPAVRGR
jgi:hypothetical protein